MKSATKQSEQTAVMSDNSIAIQLAVRYVRVSTDMQVNEGISLDVGGQQSPIEQYCALYGVKLGKVSSYVI